ncbi:MAG TPA: DNA polymerase Y family protein [Acidobacteriaceae bacterium]|jgi:protein ImuB|nr:DNA polymerase Y family protein [Acidobacteriaceae bacterium]
MNQTVLYACLYAREFPAQAMLRLRPALRLEPVAVLQGEPPRQLVCSRNGRARALGVTAGMTRAELDVFPTVARLARSLVEETSARAALLACAGQFSPRVEDRSLVPENEGCFCAVLDIAGTEKLFGTPEKLAKKLLGAVRALGIRAVVVVSRNLDAAICMARSLHPQAPAIAGAAAFAGWSTAVLPWGEEADALAMLPLAVLPLTPEHAETLARWGIATLGALAALPEKELIARLGQEGQRLRQLARGEAPHLLVPAEPKFLLEERMELDAPVELLDSLLFVLGVLLDHLIARAVAHILALASVTVTLALEGGSTHTRTHTRTVRPALPGNERGLWLKLLHLDLQAHPPAAAIVGVTVSAEPGNTSKVQMGLFSPQLPEPSRLDVTLARIRSIVGDDRAGHAVLEDTHRPDAFRVAPFAVPPLHVAAAARGRSRKAVRRLRPPERVAMTLNRRRPASFFFRNQRYQVEQAYGPWFFSGNWWGTEMWSVEKWDVIARAVTTSAAARAGNETICCCLARHPAREDWQLEALYD